MSNTDSIAAMLTKIRNATAAGKSKVDVKASRMNQGILDILKKEKFIQNVKPIADKTQGLLRVYLSFDEEGNSAIRGLERVSKSGLRIYAKSKKIPKVLSGLGLAIVSTSQGLMTDNEAREKIIGGEVLCRVW